MNILECVFWISLLTFLDLHWFGRFNSAKAQYESDEISIPKESIVESLDVMIKVLVTFLTEAEVICTVNLSFSRFTSKEYNFLCDVERSACYVQLCLKIFLCRFLYVHVSLYFSLWCHVNRFLKTWGLLRCCGLPFDVSTEILQ